MVRWRFHGGIDGDFTSSRWRLRLVGIDGDLGLNPCEDDLGFITGDSHNGNG